MVDPNFLLPILALCLTMLQGTISADPLSHICSPSSTNYTTHPPTDHSLSPLLRTHQPKLPSLASPLRLPLTAIPQPRSLPWRRKMLRLQSVHGRWNS
ncbi:hypothetical protein AMTR_s00035p00102380 [Amborella trichopoda]|uniref:Uncharacterized protein n=1 Tax=Amborella trichopoda TaxID=13333 RepID=W1PVD1_AMBTC|nr:hypothetical protein AMTR_s00035p00102380 [Amborella trichopoda]